MPSAGPPHPAGGTTGAWLGTAARAGGIIAPEGGQRDTGVRGPTPVRAGTRGRAGGRTGTVTRGARGRGGGGDGTGPFRPAGVAAGRAMVAGRGQPC